MFILGRVGLGMLGLIWFSILGGTGGFFIEKIYTLEGLAQIVIVLGVPISIGVWRAAISEKREKKLEEYTNKLLKEQREKTTAEAIKKAIAEDRKNRKDE